MNELIVELKILQSIVVQQSIIFGALRHFMFFMFYFQYKWALGFVCNLPNHSKDWQEETINCEFCVSLTMDIIVTQARNLLGAGVRAVGKVATALVAEELWRDWWHSTGTSAVDVYASMMALISIINCNANALVRLTNISIV